MLLVYSCNMGKTILFDTYTNDDGLIISRLFKIFVFKIMILSEGRWYKEVNICTSSSKQDSRELCRISKYIDLQKYLNFTKVQIPKVLILTLL